VEERGATASNIELAKQALSSQIEALSQEIQSGDGALCQDILVSQQTILNRMYAIDAFISLFEYVLERSPHASCSARVLGSVVGASQVNPSHTYAVGPSSWGG